MYYKSRLYVVYQLFDSNGNLLYIGKSSLTNLEQRINSHRKDKDFDYYKFQVIGECEKLALQKEQSLILTCFPSLNKMYKRKKTWVIKRNYREWYEQQSETPSEEKKLIAYNKIVSKFKNGDYCVLCAKENCNHHIVKNHAKYF